MGQALPGTGSLNQQIKSLIPGEVPFIAIGNARHHLFLDEPLAFVDALRTVCGRLSK